MTGMTYMQDATVTMEKEATTRGIRKVLVLPPDLLHEVEEHRRTLRPIPSSSEAIRQLIRAGLEAVRKTRPSR
jgi:metal-responsive CopG/Arc/MetJ family transcriptional regulator